MDIHLCFCVRLKQINSSKELISAGTLRYINRTLLLRWGVLHFRKGRLWSVWGDWKTQFALRTDINTRGRFPQKVVSLRLIVNVIVSVISKLLIGWNSHLRLILDLQLFVKSTTGVSIMSRSLYKSTGSSF